MLSLLLRAGALALCLAPAASTAAATAPARLVPAAPQPLTAEQWRTDLRVLAESMEKRHKNLFHRVSRAEFAAAVAGLDANIPSLQRHEIIVGFMRIAAMIGDGHTNVSPLKDAAFRFRSLPFKLYLFDDGLFVRAAKPAHAELLGAEIEAIGGVPVAEAIRRATEISPADNAVTPKLYVPIFLGMPEIQHALGLAQDTDAAVLTLRKGKRRWTVTIPAGDVDPLWPPDTDISLVTPEGWLDARAGAARPMWLQAPLDYHRIIDMPEHQALYVQLNMVTNTAQQTLAEFGSQILERSRATNPRRIILDVRLNRGGNQDLRHAFIASLIKAEDADTRLFVLVRRGAFSATQPILDELARLTDAVLIGEPASSRPNSFGDSYRSTLPNSGLTVRTSIKWHQFGRDDQPWTPIDVATPYRFADYAAGRDPALAAALDHVPAVPLPERAIAAAQADGPEGALRVARAFLSDPANRFADAELALIEVAQGLYRAGLTAPALAVGGLATERFPQSAPAWTVTALIADGAGQSEAARRAGLEALRLEPDSRTIQSMLDRLKTATNGRAN